MPTLKGTEFRIYPQVQFKVEVESGKDGRKEKKTIQATQDRRQSLAKARLTHSVGFEAVQLP